MGCDETASWLRVTAVNVGAAATQLLADGAYRIKRAIFFNSTGAVVDYQVHDHASALSDSNPIRATVPGNTTVIVDGPFRFVNGVQAAASVSDAESGITLVYRPFRPTLE